MRSSAWRLWAIVVAALAVPIVPLAILGQSLDQQIAAWCRLTLPRGEAAILVTAVLALDVLLPVPSSLVSTFAGARLGFLAGLATSMLGMTLGAVTAFYLARRWGRPMARRFAQPRDLRLVEAAFGRIGWLVLVLARGLPILAEASVLLAGAAGMSWGRFLLPVCLSNLGISGAYAAAGHWAQGRQALGWMLAASVAVPLAATGLARWLWSASDAQASE